MWKISYFSENFSENFLKIIKNRNIVDAQHIFYMMHTFKVSVAINKDLRAALEVFIDILKNILTRLSRRGRKVVDHANTDSIEIQEPIVLQAIIAEAGLSFLGLGTQPPDPAWGLMLSQGRKFMELSPGLAIFPGLAIVVTVLAFNFLGDGLRDALDPRLKL